MRIENVTNQRAAHYDKRKTRDLCVMFYVFGLMTFCLAIVLEQIFFGV
jgi:hypothetical protein